jgi:Vacuolar (H+)-ATPase G subunit
MRNACPAAKSDRLKQAKAEADKEIQAYKQDKENSFQQKVSAVRNA